MKTITLNGKTYNKTHILYHRWSDIYRDIAMTKHWYEVAFIGGSRELVRSKPLEI